MVKLNKKNISICDSLNPFLDINPIVSIYFYIIDYIIKQNENYLKNSINHDNNNNHNNNININITSILYEDHFEIVEKYDEEGLKNGFFVQRWNDGKYLLGHYEKGKIDGWAQLNNLKIKMEGQFSQNKINGYGEVYNMEDNKLLKGYWINGILGGVGLEKGPDYIYFGYFIKSDKNGYGTQIWDDKSKYEGEWKDNEFSGYGIYYFPDGRKYIGEWEHSVKNGFGKYSWPDGKIYVGYFENDKKDGFGIYYLKKNHYIINFWKDGKRDGLGKYIKENYINYQMWDENKLIKENMDEDEFIQNFDDDTQKYLYIFQFNNDEILEFMNINE